MPNPWLHLSLTIYLVGKTADGEIEISSGNDIIYFAIEERFFRIGSNMIPAQSRHCIWTHHFDVGDTLPVALDHRSLSLYRYQIGRFLGDLAQPLVVGFLF